MKWYFVVLICRSLTINAVEQLFMCLSVFFYLFIFTCLFISEKGRERETSEHMSGGEGQREKLKQTPC